MGLFKRISDIISANLGEMAEQFEDPEKMLKQAIREMEESIQKATDETARAMASEKKLARELASNENELRQWQSRAEKAVESGDDELARKALTRKQEHDKLVVALKDQMSAAGDASRTLRTQLDGMKAKLAEAKRNLATLSARKRAADVRKKAYTAKTEVGEVGLNDEAFQKFERMKEKVEMAEAEAEALAELQGITPADDFSSDFSSGDSDIEAQLEALKKKREKG
jgi:phage shock protein A